MSAIDAYGEFDLPEEKSAIEVVEDPVKSVLSCYDFFIKTSVFAENRGRYRDTSILPQIYDKVADVFKGKESLKWDSVQLECLIKNLAEKMKKSGDEVVDGLFLSALLNQTNIKTLYINESVNFRYMGYELKKDKTLAVGSKVSAFYLGCLGKGNTINLSNLYIQGVQTSGGIHINKGKISGLQGAGGAGIFINRGYAFSQGLNYLNDNIFINDEHTTEQGNYDLKGLFINLKNLEQFDKKAVIDLSSATTCVLRQELQQKLYELDFLDRLEDMNYEQAFNAVDSFDWNKFEDDIKRIAERIRRSYVR